MITARLEPSGEFNKPGMGHQSPDKLCPSMTYWIALTSMSDGTPCCPMLIQHALLKCRANVIAKQVGKMLFTSAKLSKADSRIPRR